MPWSPEDPIIVASRAYRRRFILGPAADDVDIAAEKHGVFRRIYKAITSMLRRKKSIKRAG